MDPHDIMIIMGNDQFYLEAFCLKYKAQVVDVFPNTEDYPPQGLMYVFNNQQGGFSIEGIKNSLEDKVSK